MEMIFKEFNTKCIKWENGTDEKKGNKFEMRVNNFENRFSSRI